MKLNAGPVCFQKFNRDAFGWLACRNISTILCHWTLLRKK